MRTILALLAVTMMCACTADRSANCIVTPTNLVECKGN